MYELPSVHTSIKSHKARSRFIHAFEYEYPIAKLEVLRQEMCLGYHETRKWQGCFTSMQIQKKNTFQLFNEISAFLVKCSFS